MSNDTLHTINYSSCAVFKNVIQFPCHLISPCYFYTTSLSHRTLLFVQMTHLSNVIHQITQLWNLMRFQLMSCEAVHLHFTLLWLPASTSFISYFQLGCEIPVQEKPTVFKRMVSLIKPSNQGLKFVPPPSLLFQWALWIQHSLIPMGLRDYLWLFCCKVNHSTRQLE